VRSRSSFLGGAFILAAAGLFCRLLGAVYRIPLSRLIGDEGMGLFQMAYPIYSTVLMLSTMGLPVAVSKIVAEKVAKGDRRGAHRTFRLAFGLLAGVGALGSIGLYLVADEVAAVIAKDVRAYWSLAVISPAIFFVAAMSAFRGYFQGLQNMMPTALSQVVEQSVRVLTMFIAASILLPRGVEYAAAGATFGAVTGGLAGLLLLIAIYLRYAGAHPDAVGSAYPSSESRLQLASRLIRLAIPISLTGIMMPLIQLTDMLVVPTRLRAAGVVAERATALYGQLTGMAFPLVNMPTLFTAALATSLVPAISEGVALGRASLLSSRVRASLRLTFALAIPASVGLAVLSRDICALLYALPEAGTPLLALSPALVFLCLTQTTSGVLHGLGLADLPLKHIAVGVMVKFALGWWLTALPALGIAGAAIGTVGGFLVASTLNLAAVGRRAGGTEALPTLVFKPLVAAALMGATVRLCGQWLSTIIRPSGLVTVLCIGAGALVYMSILVLVGGVTERDFSLIPVVGNRLAEMLRKLRWGSGRR